MTGFLEYVPGTSFLHRMNPSVKLGCAFLLAIACFVTSSFFVLALVVALDVAMAVTCRMQRQTLGLVKAVLAFSVVLALIALLTTSSGAVLVALPWGGYVGTGGVMQAFLVMTRLVACAVPLFLVFYVTKLTDLANSLVVNVGLPYRIAFVFMSTVRFILVFMNDMALIMEAQTARGVEFDGGLVKKVRLMVPLCVPLLVGSVRKANSSAIAAEVRGFYLRGRSSAFKEYPVARVDAVAFAICVGLLVLAIVQRLFL